MNRACCWVRCPLTSRRPIMPKATQILLPFGSGETEITLSREAEEKATATIVRILLEIVRHRPESKEGERE